MESTWNPHGMHMIHQVAGTIFRIPWIRIRRLRGIRWIRGWAAGLRITKSEEVNRFK